ncbi:MAG: aromatic ring-hydroxylating dioxygenase subunit alpha [Deltaproteobacteria bacterium]|nr:aromatic ring-hydroxylating dioxygenase subunit alpha [Deltaproteobacteria bacterium]
MFIHNDWYIAAWGSEIKGRPFARTILNQPLVLYRERNGKVAALEDRCCHRGTPLAHGTVVSEGLQCGYHGLVFAASGACVRVPGQEHIPAQARVRSYPVVEQDEFVWIWMGDAAQADRSRIISYPYHNDYVHWPHKCTTLQVKCDYLLLIDNLMDLTHLGYVHGRTVGGAPMTHVAAKMDIIPTPTGVKFIRWMLNSVPPATYAKAVGFKGRVDRWQETEFIAPSSVLQFTGALEAGRGAYEQGKREGGFALRLFHGITPETDETCFYFWSAANGYRQDDPAATEQLFNDIAVTFDEDRLILEAQHARLQGSPTLPLLDIDADGVRIQARRHLERRLAEETEMPAAK